MGVAIIIPGINFASSGLGSVTLAQDVPVTALSIVGANSVSGGSDAAQYTVEFTPAGTSERSVAWSITSGGTYATIDASTGVLSVLNGASNNSVTIRVTSLDRQTVYAEKTITVTYASGSDLPAGAIECELVYTRDGSSFVETGITPGATMSFELEAYWILGTAIEDALGIGNISANSRYVPFRFEERKPEVCYGGWAWLEEVVWDKSMYLKSKAVMTASGATVDHYDWEGNLIKALSASYSESAYNFQYTLPILGSKSSASAINLIFKGGIKRLKVYSDDHYGTLVADFIACYYNGNFGFWDKVSETFKVGTTPSELFGVGSNWDTNGFRPNSYVDDTAVPAYISQQRGLITSRLFEVPSGCTQVRFNAGTTGSDNKRRLMFLDSSKLYKDYFNYNSADRVVSVPSGGAYLMMTMDDSLKESCYIYDVTNSQYIWKGSNVQ